MLTDGTLEIRKLARQKKATNRSDLLLNSTDGLTKSNSSLQIYILEEETISDCLLHAYQFHAPKNRLDC